MKFSQESKLSLDEENEWLNYLDNFEKQFAEKKRTTVWKYIGQPEYKKIKELEMSEISRELNRLSDIMNKNGISLDVLAEVEEKDLYCFITEELFEEEIDDIHIQGMMHCFIYEEFYPDAKMDIEQTYEYFFSFTLGKSENIGGTGYDMLYIDTDNYQDDEGNILEKDYVETTINNFLNSFDFLEVINNEICNIEINEEKTKATLSANIHFKGSFKGRPEYEEFKGKGTFLLKPSKYGGWDMFHIDMPGLDIS